MGAWASFRVGCLCFFSTWSLELIFDFGCVIFFRMCPRVLTNSFWAGRSEFLSNWLLGLLFVLVVELVFEFFACTSFGCAQDVSTNSCWDGRLDSLSKWLLGFLLDFFASTIFRCGCLNFCRVCPRLFNQLLLGWARGLPLELVACVSSRLGCLDFGCAQVLGDSSPDGRLDLFRNHCLICF